MFTYYFYWDVACIDWGLGEDLFGIRRSSSLFMKIVMSFARRDYGAFFYHCHMLHNYYFLMDRKKH